MPRPGEGLFDPDVWRSALEKYAAVTHLTVQLYDPAVQLVCGPVYRTPLFELLEAGDPPVGFSECARQCLARAAGAPSVVVQAWDGVAVVGAALRLADDIVGAAVAGYAVTDFPQTLAIERLARDHRVGFDVVWPLVRSISPVPAPRLTVYGELLQVLGDALLKEQALTRASERLYREAHEAGRVKDEFLSTLSHELRSPLSAIVGWVQVGRTRMGDEAMVARAFDTIERNAKAQTALIEDLLDVSRIVTGRLGLNVQPIELIPLIEAALDVVRPAAQAKAIRLTFEGDRSTGPMLGDPDRLQQVLWNLLSNAVKFTPREGSVEIRLRRVDSRVEITVRDTGEGIRPEFLPDVFDRFRQADSTAARRHGGLGLGLSIVRHLVELHGGAVHADSPGEGQGATFTVTLPVSGVVAAARGPEGREDVVRRHAVVEVGGVIEPRALDGIHVLVVDDDADAREWLSALLQHAGARVSTAGSAADALDVLDRVRPGLLVVDVGMPVEDGYALLRKVRALPPAHGGTVAAIAVTAYARPEDRAQALAAGFHAHVAKPVDVAGLISLVASLAGRTAAG